MVDDKDGPMSWGHLKENQANEVSLLAKKPDSQTISVETDSDPFYPFVPL